MDKMTWADLIDFLPTLLHGLAYSLGISAVVIVFSIIAGVCVAFMRVSRYRSVRGSVLAYVEFIRCTPALVQLYYIFYVIPIFGLTLEALTAGIVGFTIIYTAYLSEVFRAAINSVAKTQIEAAISLGMSNQQARRLVIIPQAARVALPPTVNYLLSLIKDTSLLSIITIQEIMFRGLILASQTFKYFTILTEVAFLYFCVCFPLTILARRLEAKFERELGYGKSNGDKKKNFFAVGPWGASKS
ncbi:amino acid ABC transporter permease [Actinomycetes bacterium]|nr:amino acid ABC transporter permease [Actinomycetes bacterium]